MNYLIIYNICGCIIIFIGVILILIQVIKHKHCSAKITGKVIDVIRHDDKYSNTATLYSLFPVFEYIINDQVYTKESKYGATKCNLIKDQKVTIHYNPKNPNEFYVSEFKVPKIIGIVLIIIGFIWLIIFNLII